MPTRRKLIAGGGALLFAAACGGDDGGPDAAAPTPTSQIFDLVTPPDPAFALAFIAQARGLWGDFETNLATSDDDAGVARAFNSELVAIGGMTLDKFLFWRSGGTRIQLFGWASHPADLARAGVYAVRQDMEDQARVLGRFVAGLRSAEAWMRSQPQEAASLVAGQIGQHALDPAMLTALVAGADANRMLLAPGPDGESASLRQMRPIDAAMRDADKLGHVAFLPDIIAASAAAAWAR